MRIALLGTDPDLLQLASAAVGEGHVVSWLGDVRNEDAVAVERLAPGRPDQSDEWELVVDRNTADAVFIGRGSAPAELRAEQLKRIAAEAMPMLVVHPACDSVLPYYEVDMTRREMGGLVRHYNPVSGHPVFELLSAWVRDGHPAIGSIHQVTCERRLSDTSRRNVLLHLDRDVEPLAVVAGDIRRVSAIGPRIDQESFAALQVQMTCNGPASVRWSVGTAAGANPSLMMTLVGERGSVTLHAFDAEPFGEPQPWTLEITVGQLADRQSLESFDPARLAIQQFDRAINTTDGEQQLAMSTWSTATRDMEVADAIELSLEKGRTLDVHQQELTEQLAFRGTMSAIGCGLLFVGFFIFIGVSLFGAAEGKERPQLIASWPVILLAVLAFFLLLQCAPLLIGKSKKSRQTDTTDDSLAS
jgi:hypothetical protein